jgi:hypothetical protein
MNSFLVDLPPELLWEIVNHVAEQEDTCTAKLPLQGSNESVTDNGSTPIITTVEHPVAPLRRCVTLVY